MSDQAHCTRMSGLTDFQHRLLKADAHREALEAVLFEAKGAGAEIEVFLVIEIEEHLAALKRLSDFCTTYGWQRGAT